MAKAKKFQDRYILGEGYPWAMGKGPYTEVGLTEHNRGTLFQELAFPKKLCGIDVPKYRLVLERVK